MEGYNTIKSEVITETEIKRSRFIATLIPCETEEQANEFIQSMRKKYWDAKHNVYAFSLKEKGIRRFSDDGEPHSTAGLPVLETIIHSGYENVALVVTRYFGGILLGTGGLVRAYSEAAKSALDLAEKVEILPAISFKINCDYSDYDALVKLLSAEKVKLLNSNFDSLVTLDCVIRETDFENFSKNLTDYFCARLKIEEVFKKFIGF